MQSRAHVRYRHCDVTHRRALGLTDRKGVAGHHLQTDHRKEHRVRWQRLTQEVFQRWRIEPLDRSAWNHNVVPTDFISRWPSTLIAPILRWERHMAVSINNFAPWHEHGAEQGVPCFGHDIRTTSHRALACSATCSWFPSPDARMMVQDLWSRRNSWWHQRHLGNAQAHVTR